MFDNQSKTVNLLQLSVPHVPLFLHPLGELFDLELHVLQDINYNILLNIIYTFYKSSI